MVWTGSQHGVVWHDIEINLVRIDCLCPDADSDAFSACMDCDDTNPDVFPGAPQICDGLNNDCDHANWPALTGTNEEDVDGDGLSECDGDCRLADPLNWATPGEAASLRLDHDPASGLTTLTWQAPVAPGAATVSYDTIRSGNPANFVQGASCVEANGSDQMSVDGGGNLPAGAVFYYLVRAENDCPIGDGDLGLRTGGIPRTARSCP